MHKAIFALVFTPICLLAMESSEKKGTLFWVDLEMSNIDLQKGRIIELACIVTDNNLTIIKEGPNIPINQPEDVLAQASNWVKEHIPNALTRSRNSTISTETAETEVIQFLLQHTNATKISELKNTNPLPAGNCVQTDLQFLNKYMPKLAAYLNYRIMDVSTIAEIIKRWYPPSLKSKIEADIKAIKTGSHKALQDIRESIAELQYYRNTIFKSPEELEDALQDPNENQYASQPTHEYSTFRSSDIFQFLRPANTLQK